MYTVNLLNCICRPSQARRAEALYREALDTHFGSPAATVTAFKCADDDGFTEALWLQADYAASCVALADIGKRCVSAHFEIDLDA